MTKDLLYFLLILFSSACSKEIEIAHREVDETASGKIQSRSAGDGEWDILGYSFDITDNYLGDPRLPVIDLDRFYASHPNLLEKDLGSESETLITYGENYQYYMKELVRNSGINLTSSRYGYDAGETAKKGVSSLFSGNISSNKNFTKRTERTSEFAFITAEVITRIKAVKFNPLTSIDTLRNYLREEFVSFSKTASPDDFVKAYGTHVLLDVKLGGRMELVFRSKVSTSETTVQKEKIVKAGFGAKIISLFGFNIGGEFENQTNTAEIEKNKEFVFHSKTYGGGKAIDITITPGTTTSPISYSNWQNSVNQNNCRLVNINWDQVIPIYKLIPDPSRQILIKQAAERYIESKREVLLKPLYRFYSPKLKDNMYGTCWDEGPTPTYPIYVGIEGYVFAEQLDGTIALHRCYAPKEKDHLLGRETEMKGPGHNYEGIVGYVYPDKGPIIHTIPLKRYYKIYGGSYGQDHLYTTNPAKEDLSGFIFESTICYLPTLDFKY